MTNQGSSTSAEGRRSGEDYWAIAHQATQPPSSSIDVGFVFNGVKIWGQVNVESARRVSDALNTPDEVIVVKNASVLTLNGEKIDDFRELMVEKRRVLVAVPKEPAGHRASERFVRLGLQRPDLARSDFGVVVPPFTARGQIHLQPPINLHTVLGRLQQYFPLTDAKLLLDGVTIEENGVFLINRDYTVGMALDQPAAAPQARAV